MSLGVLVQRNFSGGFWANPSRELIPENGVAKARNALLEEDGTIFRRGGSEYLTSAFGTDLRFLWDGYLTAGDRTLVASTTDFGVVDQAGTGLVNLGGSGTDGQRPAAGTGMVFVPCGSSGVGTVAVYAGSRKGSYSFGDITTTDGSTTVTGGGGTTWSAGVDAGMVITSGGQFVGVVKEVTGDTSLELRSPAATVLTAAAYSAVGVYEFQPTAGDPVAGVATISNPVRLIVGNGDQVHFSASGNPLSFDPTDYYLLPGGAQVLGLEALRNVLFVFTTAGVFTVTGLDYDLTDALGNVQHRVEQISRDLVLADARGIAGWRGSLLVPCTDDVYLVSESAAPEPVSAPIRLLYRSYVKEGYGFGHATVYRNHLFLPVVNGSEWIDTLVLRLDQGGWTQWDGHGGTSLGFAARSKRGAQPARLLSINAGRVLDLAGAFDPDEDNTQDADGTVHQFEVVTRDFTTDGLRRALVKKIRLRYELNDTGDTPTIRAGFGTGQVSTAGTMWGSSTWGSFLWGGASSDDQFVDMDGEAPPDNGTSPFVWPVIPGETGVRPRFARFRFVQDEACSGCKIRALEVFIRQGGRQ
jgi:hypothetical protein